LSTFIKDEEEIGSLIEEGKRSFSHRLSKSLYTTGAKDGLDIINSLLSVTMALAAAVDTYSINPDGNSIIKILNICFLLFFFGDLILNLYISENKFGFVLKWSTLMEYITIVP
jgi:hypothetical protein